MLCLDLSYYRIVVYEYSILYITLSKILSKIRFKVKGRRGGGGHFSSARIGLRYEKYDNCIFIIFAI